MTSPSGNTPNLLIHEASAYLRQHALNPVYWRTWSDEAFRLAAEQDKPVFVSIGYSTCHWCHVMAHESFEDADVAAFLNEHFISVKVDREERPDIDALCMEVCQRTTGHGGWPLTIMMDANQRPFFAGTYFPRRSGPRRIGFLDLLQRIHEVWQSDRQAILGSAANIVEMLRQGALADHRGHVDEAVFTMVADHYRHMYDEENGGFGSAPKFPSPHHLLLLLRIASRTGDPELVTMVASTLRAMRAGGMYDQVGYGFHRYSTDARWHVPHFEKMLYDQAMLMMAYTEGWQATKDEVFRRTVLEISEYVAAEMTSASGAFHSAQDADSEGEEGKFYVFTASELTSVSQELGPNGRFGRLLDVRTDGNYVDEVGGVQTGANILHVEPDALERLLADPLWEELREQLLAIRRRRVPPMTDTKVLPDWNGLMIAALAQAARTFHEPQLGLLAKHAYAAVQPREKFLDDHAMLGCAALELYETTGTGAYLMDAVRYADIILKEFVDADGLMYAVAKSVSDIPVRPRSTTDGAYPSGNSMAATLFIRLGLLLHRDDFEQAGRRSVEQYGAHLEHYGQSYCMLLCGWDLLQNGSVHALIGGEAGDHFRAQVLDLISERHMPWLSVVHPPDWTEVEALFQSAAYPFGSLAPSTVYVCTAEACELPLLTVGDVEERLDREVQA